MNRFSIAFTLLFVLQIGALAQNEIYKQVDQKILQEEPHNIQLFEPAFINQSVDMPELGEVELLKISISEVEAAAQNNLLHIPLQFQDKELELILFAHNFRSPNFRVVELNGSQEKDVTAELALGRHYRGIVNGYPQSIVSLSIVKGQANLMISTGEEQFVIHPKAESSTDYIAYETKALAVPTPTEACKLLNAPDHGGNNLVLENNVVEGCGGTAVTVSYVADFDMFQDFGSTTGVTNFVNALINQVALLYAADDINLVMEELFVNTAEDGYPHTTSFADLEHFGNNLPNAGGNLIHLLSTNDSNLGGVAYLDVICSNSFNYGYSNIFGTFAGIPTYSWDVGVVAHELGHNLGSGHTHGCYWSTGTIDDCGNVAFANAGETPEGNACWDENNPKLPSNGGTVMSYCHLFGNIGINFSLGFGETGQRIRSRIDAAPCVTSVGGGDYVSLAANPAYTTITANRTCPNGAWVDYIFDNNTPEDFDDDVLVLSIRNNGQNIGTLDDEGFVVSLTSTTDANAGGGLEVTPTYKTNPNQLYLGKRFWTVSPINQPTQPVGVRFPIKLTDLAQLNENVPQTGVPNLALVSFAEPLNVDPETGHVGINHTQVDEYMFSNQSSSLTQFTSVPNDSEIILEFNTNRLYGGTFGVTANQGNITPFVLSSFAAGVNDEYGVDLIWSSSEEFNASRYELEKSFNNGPFEVISITSAVGTTKTGSTYNFEEEFAFAGTTKYRLRMIGNRGTEILSEEIVIEDIDFGDEVRIAPNPLGSIVNLQVDLRPIFPVSEDVILTIYNVAGQKVRVFEANTQIVDIDIRDLATGTYFLHLSNENTSKTLKFVKAN